jgi:hypothetical protein
MWQLRFLLVEEILTFSSEMLSTLLGKLPSTIGSGFTVLASAFMLLFDSKTMLVMLTVGVSINGGVGGGEERVLLTFMFNSCISTSKSSSKHWRGLLLYPSLDIVVIRII